MCSKEINPESKPKKNNWITHLEFEPQTQQVIENCSQDIGVSSNQTEHDPEPESERSSSPIIGQKKSPSTRNRIPSINSSLNIEEINENLTPIDIEELFTQDDTNSQRTLNIDFECGIQSNLSLISCSSSKSKHGGNSKRKFKPQGLAQQAVKVLRDQKTLNDIWTHLDSKHKMEDSYVEDSDKVCLLVTDEIYEFGRLILVCASVSTASPCLLLMPIGVENVIKGRRVIVYPPFARKFIDYRGSVVSFYFAAERLLWEDEEKQTGV